MADRSIGKIFVELDLDPKDYTRKQKKLISDVKSSSLSIEENFRKMGATSVKEMDLMRQKINQSYMAIAKNAKATQAEIVYAERIKNEQLKKLNEQQFGEQKTLVQKLKENWLAAISSIYLAWQTVRHVLDVAKEITWQAAKFETFGIVMRVVGNNAGYTGKQMEDFSKALQKNGIAMMESRRVLMMMAEAHIDLNKSQELGRIAQNAAVIGMMNSSQAMEQMIWGIQSANLRVLRTIGINVSFERSYQKMVDAMNAMDPTAKRTVENLTELEKVTARTNEVIGFGPRIYGTYTAAMETAAKQALSLQRYWDNLKILAGSIFTPVFAQIVGDITGSIIDLNKDLEQNKELMNEYGNKLRLKFVDVEISILSIINSFEKMTDLFSGAKDPYLFTDLEMKEKGVINLKEAFDEFLGKIKELSYYNKTGIMSSWDTIYPTAEAEERMKKLVEMSDKEIKNLKEKLKDSDQLSSLEKKINGLMEAREQLLFSMTEEGKKQQKEREDAAEQERLLVKKEMDLKNKQEEQDRKINEANAEAHEKIIELRSKENEKLRKDIEENSIKAEQVGKEYFESEKVRINKLRDMYEAMGLDQVLIDRWAKNEMIIAADKYRQHLEKESEKTKKAAEKESRNLVDISKRTAEAMESTMSDIFFDAIVGELKDLRDYALSFLRSVARALADFYAQRATAYIVSEIVSAASSSEYPISNEDYYGPYSSQSLSTSGASMFSSNVAPTQEVNYNIYANDSKSFTQMVENNPQAINVVVQKLMKNNTALRNTIKRTG